MDIMTFNCFHFLVPVNARNLLIINLYWNNLFYYKSLNQGCLYLIGVVISLKGRCILVVTPFFAPLRNV